MSTCIIDGSPILVTAELIKALDHKANDAILLQQVWFWQQVSRNEHDGHTWVYNTYDAWAEQTGLTVRQVRHSAARLVELGLLVTCQPGRFDRTTWYRVDRDHPLLNPTHPSARTGTSTSAATGTSDVTEMADVSSTERTTERTQREEPLSTDVDQPVLELVQEQVQADTGFEELWENYPRRNGRRAGSKAKAQKRWKALSRTERLQVLVAVDNYRRERAPTGNGQYVMDLARFLGTEWETWVEPAAQLPMAPLSQQQIRDPFLASLGPGSR